MGVAKMNQRGRGHFHFALSLVLPAITFTGCLNADLNWLTSSTPITLSTTQIGSAVAGSCVPVSLTPESAPEVSTTFSLTITPAGSGTFYLDDTCMGAAVTSAVLPAASSSLTVYVRPTLAGSNTVRTGASGHDSAELTFTVSASGPSAADSIINANPDIDLVLNSGISTVELTAKDEFGNTISGLTVDFTISGTGNILLDLAENPLGSTTMTTDASGKAAFKIKSSVAENKDVSVSSPTALSTVPPKVISFGTDPRLTSLSVVSMPSSLTAGACQTFSVRALDQYGAAFTLPSTMNGTLNVSGTGNAYPTAGCATGGSTSLSFSISSGMSETSLYFKSTVTDPSVTLTAHAIIAPAANDGTHALTIVPGDPWQATSLLTATPTGGIYADGVQSSTIVITLRDEFANVIPSKSITLSAPVGAIVQAPATQTTDVSGQATFHVAATAFGSHRFTTDALPPASFYVDVDFLEVPYLNTIEMVLAGGTSRQAGECFDYTVTLKDQSDTAFSAVSAVTVDLSGTPNVPGSFFSDCAFTTPVSNLVFSTGVSSKSFALRAETVTTPTATITASTGALNDNSTVTVAAGPASAVKSILSASPTSGLFNNGTDTSTITLTLKDAFENPVNGAPVLSVSGSGNSLGTAMTAGETTTWTLSTTQGGTKRVTVATPAFGTTPFVDIIFDALPVYLGASETAVSMGLLGVMNSRDKIIQLGNGHASQTINSISAEFIGSGFSFKGGTYPGTGGNCGETLAPQTSCLLVLRFSPSAAQVYNSTLTITNSPGASVVINLSGEGTNAAALSLNDYPRHFYEEIGLPTDPATFDFGPVGTAHPAFHVFELRNDGVSATAISIQPLSAPYSVESTNCGPSLSAASACNIRVTYSPVAQQPDPAALVITGGPGAVRPLSGTGVSSGPILRLHDYFANENGSEGISLGSSLNFGTVPVASAIPTPTGSPGMSNEIGTHYFVVQNRGNDPSAVSASVSGPGFEIPGGFPGPKAGLYAQNNMNFCSSVLPGGGRCVVEVALRSDVPGLKTGQLNVTGATPSSRALRGWITNTPLLSARRLYSSGDSPGIVEDLGVYPINQVTETWIQVRNLGGAPAFNLSAALTGAGSGFNLPAIPPQVTVQYSTFDSCHGLSSLPVGSYCVVKVEFAPGSTVGDFEKTLTLSYDGGNASKLLKATSTNKGIIAVSYDLDPSWSSDAAYLYFDTVPAGQSVFRTFIVRNKGAGSFTIPTYVLPTGYSWDTGQPTQSFWNYITSNYDDVGNCPFDTPIAGGDVCYMQVRFTAAGDLDYSTRVPVPVSNAMTSDFQLDVTAVSSTKAILGTRWNAFSPVNEISSPGYAQFPLLALGQSRDQFVLIANKGSGSATFQATGHSFASAGFEFYGSAFPGGSGDQRFYEYPGSPTYIDVPFCSAGFVLASGAQCVIRVVFQPLADDYYYGELTLNVTGGTGTTMITFSGRGTNSGILAIQRDLTSDSRLPQYTGIDFPTAGRMISKLYALKNVGNSPLTVQTPESTESARFGFNHAFSGTPDSAMIWNGSVYQSVNFCQSAQILNANDFCLVDLTFFPDSFPGYASGMIRFQPSEFDYDLKPEFSVYGYTETTYNTGSTTATHNLSDCVGGCKADFGTVNVGSSSTRYLVLHNLSKDGLDMQLWTGSISISTANPSEFQYSFGTGSVTVGPDTIPRCVESAYLVAGERCALSVQFTPDGVAGLREASIYAPTGYLYLIGTAN